MKISVKILADFMLATSLRQRSIVRDAKFPKFKDGKPKPQIVRYSEARAAIRDYHEAGNDLNVFSKAVDRLIKKKAEYPEKDITRIEDNIRAIKAYLTHFSKREFSVLPTPKPVYEIGEMQVFATPDLFVEENGVKRLVKFDFSQQKPRKEIVKIILKVMHEAASQQNLAVKPKDVLYLDVSHQTCFTGEKLNKKLKKEVDAAIATMQDMWGNIKQD